MTFYIGRRVCANCSPPLGKNCVLYTKLGAVSGGCHSSRDTNLTFISKPSLFLGF
jgi:hypothetical protein